MQRLGKTALMTLATVATLFMTTAGHAGESTKIYKWVDQKGETHFSQIPPRQGKAQQINPDYAAPTTKEPEEGAPVTPPSNTQNKSKLPNDAKITVFNKKAAEKACKLAEAQLKTLKSPDNQLMTQDKDGKFRALTPTEIAGRMKQAQDVADKACVK